MYSTASATCASLRLDSNDLASPPEDVFDGLDSLTHLYLSHNRIHTLPEDVFEGLGNLTSLLLHSNPGTPFTLTADLERQGDNAVLVKVAEAVPFDMAVTFVGDGWNAVRSLRYHRRRDRW